MGRRIGIGNVVDWEGYGLGRIRIGKIGTGRIEIVKDRDWEG